MRGAARQRERKARPDNVKGRRERKARPDNVKGRRGAQSSELRSCVKVVVTVLVFSPRIVRAVSVDVKQH